MTNKPPDDPKLKIVEFLEQGNALYDLGKHEEAINAYNKAIELNPKLASAWYNKGVALTNQGKDDEAIVAYDKAIEIDPKHASAWYNKGNALYNIGKYEEAIIAYDKAIEIGPQLADAWNNKGIALTNLEKYDDAIVAYNKAIEIDPNLASAWYNKGIALNNLGKYKDTINAYDMAIELDPKYTLAWNNKGIAFADLGKHQDAINAYRKALELKKESVNPNHNLAELYLNLGDLNPAYTTITKVPDDIKNNPMILKMRGIIEVQLQNYIGAVKSFQQAIQEDPGKVEFLAWKSYAKYLYLESTSKPEDVNYNHELMAILRTLEKACKLIETEEPKEIINAWLPINKEKATSTENSLKSQVLFFKGFCYHQLGDHHTAVEKFKKSAEYASSSEKRPQNALHNVWKNNIKPSFWNWWWNSPTSTILKRFTFLGILILILGIVFLHPLIPEMLGKSYSDINWTLYSIFLISLIVILVLPQIERIKATDFEIELFPPSTLGPTLSNIHFEGALSESAPSNKN